MPDEAKPGRRTLVGSLGWVMGIGGLGAAGITLFRSAAPAGYDPRVRVELPEKPDGYLKILTSQGRPVGILGLSPPQAAQWTPAPGAPPFIILDLVCTHDHCLVGHRAAVEPSHWVCPCCGSRYTLAGQAESGPAKRALAMPPYRFVSRRTVLIGPPFQATEPRA